MCNKTEIPNAAVGLFPPFKLLNLAPCSMLYFFLLKVCLQYQNVKFFSPISLSLNTLISPDHTAQKYLYFGSFLQVYE